ncbi:hypothetical protein JEQ12_005666 [Ovis aries]|uniref:Uncharacterized protein n=1 Tax=Ovis aries TaxID=9940 RepID=A0A836CW44_SHEEP|nr:hypothetical protein JEQ12_005666 [Ovis aries]
MQLLGHSTILCLSARIDHWEKRDAFLSASDSQYSHSMVDLVTFLEQMKDPRSIRRMETMAMYPVRTEMLFLAYDNLHELVAVSFLESPSETVYSSE